MKRCKSCKHMKITPSCYMWHVCFVYLYVYIHPCMYIWVRPQRCDRKCDIWSKFPIVLENSVFCFKLIPNEHFNASMTISSLSVFLIATNMNVLMYVILTRCLFPPKQHCITIFYFNNWPDFINKVYKIIIPWNFPHQIWL